MLGTAVDLAFHAHFLHLGANLLHHTVDELLTLSPLLAYAFGDVLVLVRVNVHHSEVFEFALEERYTEPARKRRVYVESFARYILLFFGRQIFEGTHIVQTVGEFDNDDSQIFGDRHKELAEVLRLRLFAVGKLQFVEFCDALDQFEDFVAELRGELLGGNLGVLQNVVQESGDKR